MEGSGRSAKPRAGLRLEESVLVRAGLAREELQFRLLADLREGVRGNPRRRLHGRAPERGERGDAAEHELVDLRAADAGDAREVVDLFPVRLADRLEVADVAMRARPRLGRRRVRDELLEPPADAAEVRAELVGLERRDLPGAQHDMHERRAQPLDARDLLGVEAELEDVVRLRRARELRVVDLVGVRPERGRRVDAHQEVRVSGPAGRVEEGGLVDDLSAVPHFLMCFGRRSFDVPAPVGILDVDRDNVAAAGDEVRDVGSLVLGPLALDQVALRVVDVRPLPLAARNLKLEHGQVLALEEVVKY